MRVVCSSCIFFFQAEDGIRDRDVTGVQTCALPISGAVQSSGNYRTARSLLDLWKQDRRGKAEPDALNGAEQTVARCTGDADRTKADGCDGAGGLFCAAEDLVGRAEQGKGV